MNIDSTLSAYSRAIDSAMPLIDDSLKARKNADREQDDVLAAIRGGSTNFGTESEAKKAYSERKLDASRRGMTAVEKMRASMREVLDDALSFDPADIAAVAPALALKGISENDLRALAKRYRESRGALMAIAQHGGKFASGIGVALNGYANTVSEACRKAVDFSERALYGQNGIKDGSTLRSYLDDQKENIQKTWDTLQGVIDGTATVDPMQAMIQGASK